MDYEHFMRARVANAAHGGEPTDPLAVAKAIVALGSVLAQTADESLAGIAALNELIEAGAEDEELFGSACALGDCLIGAVAVAYRLAAALMIPEFDERISAALSVK